MTANVIASIIYRNRICTLHAEVDSTRPALRKHKFLRDKKDQTRMRFATKRFSGRAFLFVFGLSVITESIATGTEGIGPEATTIAITEVTNPTDPTETAGCCNEINIEFNDYEMSNSVTSISFLNGVWATHSNFNGRPVYKLNSYFMFYTETDGPKRWLVEQTIGKTRNEAGTIVHGYMRNERDVSCPEDAGTSWSHAWNPFVVDSSITVQCGM